MLNPSAGGGPVAVIQSPMAGCTDLAFRLVAREYGMRFAFLEMVSADSLIRENTKTLSLLKTDEKDKPLGAQLVGSNPESMGEGAAMIEAMGFDLLDINMGCPVPKIVSPGGGSALLREPDKARTIFRSIMRKVKRIPVTVKMRLGFSDPSGDEALPIARAAEEEGISAVAIHGRTRAQGYAGLADWKAIGRIKQALRIPVYGNGDIMNPQDAVERLKVSGCDGLMIGRGGLGNPWIYKGIEAVLKDEPPPTEPSLEEKRRALLMHFALELQTEGEKIGLLKTRKIAGWYFKNYPGTAQFRDHVNRSESVDEVRTLIEEFLGHNT